jgi:hypothetical protein
MTRTLVDIFITLHYIANKDTDSRAQLYYQYFAKDIEGWSEVIKKFWLGMAQTVPSRTLKLAAAYPIHTGGQASLWRRWLWKRIQLRLIR